MAGFRQYLDERNRKWTAHAEFLNKRVKGMIYAPRPDPVELTGDTLFRDLADLVTLTATGDNRSLVVYGGPGVGKTFVVTKTLKDLGLVKGRDWFLLKGKTTPIALYQNLFLHRKGALLVFDDTDSIWDDRDSANIMKAALDSYEVRTISWYSSRTTNISLLGKEARAAYEKSVIDRIVANPADPNVRLPSEFEFDGRVIFISNLLQRNFDTAILSRSLKIDMSLTPDQLFRRLETMIAEVGPKDIAIEDKRMILNTLRDHQLIGDIKSPDMRTFVLACEVFKSSPDNWFNLVRYG